MVPCGAVPAPGPVESRAHTRRLPQRLSPRSLAALAARRCPRVHALPATPRGWPTDARQSPWPLLALGMPLGREILRSADRTIRIERRAAAAVAPLAARIRS